jgi:DNA-binding transcriptional MerR regulator
MKTTNKKLVGGLLIGLIISAIGAVLATAETEDTTEEINPPMPFEGRHGMNSFGPFAYNLTDEQQAELEELIEALRQENATREKIQEAVHEKLDEYGVLDAQLDSEIEQTQQKLEILNRQKELRNEGYNWDEINTIIQEEFDIENTIDMDFGITCHQGFEPGPYSGPNEFISGEEIKQ